MKHIFISHTGADRTIADQLASDLRDAGHETKVDTQELKLGDNSIQYMNEAIADADTVVILYSKHSKAAKWQKLEIDGALWNQVNQDGGTCIVVIRIPANNCAFGNAETSDVSKTSEV